MADGWVQASMRAGIGNTPWKLYLGCLDGTPVATNIVLTGADHFVHQEKPEEINRLILNL